LSSEQEQQVGFIRRAANDLYELVNDLLDLAKVEAGKIEIKPVYFEVSNLFGALRGMLRPLFLNQSVALIFEDAGSLPPLYSDEGKVSQILRNFLSNALKFTERGEVRVSASVLGDRACFCVADTGIGIAPEDRERIFQDFVQLDGPLQRQVKGTGLGLPLSKKLAQLLRGDVSVASTPGLGSTFSLDIPLRWESDIAAPVVEIVDEADASGIPVLVLENRADALLMYSRWLKDTEFRIVASVSVRDAELKIAAQRPALIVLDVLLNGEDSWGLLASLKGSPETRDIPIAMITSVEDERKALHLGANDYLLKPIDRELLLQTLRRLSGSERGVGVLIIDDDEKDRYLLKHRLRRFGFEIAEASSGAEGIAKAGSDRPKLIFLDLTMPGMNGYEVLDALKADARTASIAVIVHTSLKLTEEEQDRLRGEVTAILFKDHSGQNAEVDALIAKFADLAQAQ
jgi:CheY-like chemotaxis protein/anti-sigma regulatory factor (Ser/Thr protein kinase)